MRETGEIKRVKRSDYKKREGEKEEENDDFGKKERRKSLVRKEEREDEFRDIGNNPSEETRKMKRRRP